MSTLGPAASQGVAAGTAAVSAQPQRNAISAVGRDPHFLNALRTDAAAMTAPQTGPGPATPAPQPAAPATSATAPATRTAAAPAATRAYASATVPGPAAPQAAPVPAAQTLPTRHAPQAVTPVTAHGNPAPRQARLRWPRPATARWASEKITLTAGEQGPEILVRNHFLDAAQQRELVADLLQALADTGELPERIFCNGVQAWSRHADNPATRHVSGD